LIELEEKSVEALQREEDLQQYTTHGSAELTYHMLTYGKGIVAGLKAARKLELDFNYRYNFHSAVEDGQDCQKILQQIKEEEHGK